MRHCRQSALQLTVQCVNPRRHARSAELAVQIESLR
jgi:hypothetical protein